MLMSDKYVCILTGKAEANISICCLHLHEKNNAVRIPKYVLIQPVLQL